jgi:SIR2-like domain
MLSILLIGNGPNYFSKSPSWENVVRIAARRAGVFHHVERLLTEPLPLVYERIASSAPRADRDARSALVRAMRDLKHNEIHTELMALRFPTVLTTNYDTCLEAASGERYGPANLDSESTYSLFRRRRSEGNCLWHIHGDLTGPRTMTLGLHNYAGYLQKMRRYLTTKAEGSPVRFGDPGTAEKSRHSWADLFLRDNVHIVGLGLGYAEIDLWWLLSYKQRLRARKKVRVGSTTFYHMGTIDKATKARLDLMTGFGVRIEYLQSATGKPDRRTWEAAIAMLRAANAA